jgi:hypothetical protein
MNHTYLFKGLLLGEFFFLILIQKSLEFSFCYYVKVYVKDFKTYVIFIKN